MRRDCDKYPMTDREREALRRTGMFLSLFGWTFNGRQLWRFVACFAILDLALWTFTR